MKGNRDKHKDFLRTQSLIRKRKKKRLYKFYIIAILFFLCVSLLSVLSSLQNISIRKIIIVGNQNITSDEIQNIVSQVLNSKYIGLFSKKNVFLYPSQGIEQVLLSTYPRIKDVNLEVESFEILNIKINEKKATSVWCAAVLCYLVDSDGYIFAEHTSNAPLGIELIAPSSATTTSSYVVLKGGDQLVGSEPIGKYIFNQKLYQDILHTVEILKSESLLVKEVHVFSRDEIIFELERGGKIIFSDRKPFSVSLENLKASLKSSVFINKSVYSSVVSSSAPSSSQPTSHMSSPLYAKFEYIDVRFGNKIFYKLEKDVSEKRGQASSSVDI